MIIFSIMRRFCFLFNDTATTQIYTLSLHDALPICAFDRAMTVGAGYGAEGPHREGQRDGRSEEHTSELQSHVNLVCRLLLEKKKREANRGAQADEEERL